MLPAPVFHHLHLNSVDPEAAIDFYAAQFPSTRKIAWGGEPALRSPNDVLMLFGKVDRPPSTQSQSAIWHFGWHVTDARATLEACRSRREVKLLPLYTGDANGYVNISSDPGPAWAACCNVPRGADRTWPALGKEGMYRTPRAAVVFGDVALSWYPPQTDAPPVSSRGQLVDHIGLGVVDLDAWLDKLRSEGVVALEPPYTLGDTRAAMIEGPSREALELVEIG